MSSLPLAIAHPVLLVLGILVGVAVVAGIVMAIPDIIRYIKLTWM